MVGERPIVDLLQAGRARIAARTGDAVFVIPDFRILPGTTTTYLHPSPQRGRSRDVSLHDVEPAAWLLVSVEEESDQRP